MSRRPARFTQRDLAKAIKAVAAAGVPARVEVEKDGKIVVVVGEPGKAEAADRNEWDDDEN